MTHMLDLDDGAGLGGDASLHVSNKLWEAGTPLPIIEIETSSAFSPNEHSKLDDLAEYTFDMSPMSERRHAFSPEIRRELAESNRTELEMTEMNRSPTPRGAPALTQAEGAKADTGATLLSAPLERDQVDDDADQAQVAGVGEEYMRRKRERMSRLKTNLAVESSHPEEEERMPLYDGMQRLVGGQSGSTLGRGHAFYLQVMLYTGLLTGIDRAFLGIFTTVDSHTSISKQFPSSVFAMVFVFACLSFWQWCKPGLTDCFVQLCRPGVWFLAEWRPLFFYVPLLKLPLLQNPPDAATVFLSFLTSVCGFGLTFGMTLGAVRVWDYYAAEQMSMREGAGYVQPRRSNQISDSSVERSPIVVEELSLKAAITKRRWAWGRLAVMWLVTSLLILIVAMLVASYSSKAVHDPP
eukprot:TRINITY_DN1978_c0_g1_i11.p1 TRINITY_DN1978_c0_g1~~TRINITY_DN1978_c0_g1_i11.p1  ORF type:complete len:409 (+),score=64.70 TRINITY_DN1978_c0_g1_i11:199-1425(+)